MSDAVLVERGERVAVVTLNVPSKRNAMSAELTARFAETIELLKDDSDVNVVVFTGAGPAFSAGGDLTELEAQLDWHPETNRRHMGTFYRQYLSVLTLEVPTIAALTGHAIGAGLALALACDIRVASDVAKFGLTFLNLGLHPGMATTELTPDTVGHAHASELLLTGRLIDGARAAEIGLVNVALPPDEVRGYALAMAQEIASKPTSAVRMTKRALMRRRLRGLEAAMDYEAVAQMSSFGSDEMRAAVSSMRSRARDSKPANTREEQ